MKIAIAHYHLKTGGVTSVIRHQAEAIRNHCDVLILTGEPHGQPFPDDAIHIDGLGYDTAGQNKPNPKDVAESIIEAIRLRWSNGCDLLHVHNPTLAKNRQLLQVLSVLQEKGIRLLLQVHDFAEDGRPDAYTHHPYPSDCHWTVINSRDYQALIHAGLKSEGVHLLPNAVIPISKPDTPVSRKGFALYPVRALRRKNTGEAILLSLYFKAAQSLCISLPPNSLKDRHSHALWKRFAAAHDLKIAFDTGLTADLAHQAAGADFFITTSITEGFGFSFLEPWTIKKPLVGRRIPGICLDFEKNGILFDTLYDRIRIPLQWIDTRYFFDRYRSGAQNAIAAYGASIEEKEIQEAFQDIIDDDSVDFGILDEGSQEQVLTHLISNPHEAQLLRIFNPHLEECLSPKTDSKIIDSNREVVRTQYSKEVYRSRLLDVYSKTVDAPVRHQIEKDRLLKQFFNLNKLSLLKWGDDPR